MFYYPDREFELNTDCDEAVGLVGWWPLGAYPDGRDMSIHGNHGRLINGPVASGGGNRLGLSFDGTDDYVSLGTSTIFDFNTSMSISFWMLSSATDAGLLVGKYDNTFGGSPYMIWRGNTENVVRFYTQDAGLSADQTIGLTNVSNGLWHHILATFDGSTKRLYVDGSQEASSSETALDTAPTDLRIGTDAVAGLGYVTAVIDDVRIYNRALSATQVQKMFLDGLPGRYGPLARAKRRWWAMSLAAPPVANRYLTLLGVGA